MNKHWRGRMRTVRGKQNERSIEAQASLDPTVVLQKHYPEIRILGDINQPGNVRIVGRGEPDYTLICQNNTAIFDAKITKNKTTFSPYLKFKHQFDRMQAISEANPSLWTGYLVFWSEHETAELFPVTSSTLWKPKFSFGTGVFSSAEYSWFLDIIKFLNQI